MKSDGGASERVALNGDWLHGARMAVVVSLRIDEATATSDGEMGLKCHLIVDENKVSEIERRAGAVLLEVIREGLENKKALLQIIERAQGAGEAGGE